jgi:hypothetical protein
MPFYRINGMSVHMQGRTLPKPCVALVGVAQPGKPQSVCMDMSEFLCDWPIDGKTCDRALCEAHAKQVGKNKHYCPEHFLEHMSAEKQLGLFTSLV